MQLFGFKTPVILEDLPAGEKEEVVALDNKIVIRGDEDTFKCSLTEMLSHAKLGEIDPLLATFWFEKDMSDEDQRFAAMFHNLCKPLQAAWVYKIMRRYAPSAYGKEIKELLDMWDSIGQKLLNSGDPKDMDIVLSLFAILYDNPEYDIELEITSDDANQAAWVKYITVLKQYVRMEPDPEIYLKLPGATDAPYRMGIITDNRGCRVFAVVKEAK